MVAVGHGLPAKMSVDELEPRAFCAPVGVAGAFLELGDEHLRPVGGHGHKAPPDPRGSTTSA
ncbi:hypothetical protein SLI_2996 [Streptomyces lividans 1326]|uniref:Uncharacterized protein n=1 Tax=Streptomyces lividans 1326 TaxID=1200984 RepID=A0A7U9HAX8_STRLI|nr:hypothetical protein SLI_2996 [Streptomyces lividans 1326]